MGYERMFQLFEGVDTFRPKPRVLGPRSFPKCSREADAQEGVGCFLDCHEGLVTLEVINWIGGTVIGLHMRHLEPSRDRFVQNKSGERLGGIEIEVV